MRRGHRPAAQICAYSFLNYSLQCRQGFLQSTPAQYRVPATCRQTPTIETALTTQRETITSPKTLNHGICFTLK